MKESQVREYLTKGWIRAIVTFEIVGKPKEHIDQALTGYLDNIKQDHRIVFLKEDREEAMAHDDGMFSSFCETEMLIQNLETFTWLCINFSPASIEIIEPDEIVVQSREVTNWLNDLLSKVHEIGTNYRSHKAANEHLSIAMNQLIQNIILLTLRTGTKTLKDLERETGILEEQLEPFLTHLTAKGELEDLKGAYALPDPARKIMTPKIEAPKKKKKK
jgi:hypothetical protein